MCGIAGFLLSSTVSTKQMQHDIKNMLKIMHHRGPDDDGIYIKDKLALGHKRLAVVELSSAGDQPMHTQNERYIISYNGEIYNGNEIRYKLGLEYGNIQWRGHSDTETLLIAIERWGLDKTIANLHGMFAFALWDNVNKALFLCRDRMGEKPLYYHQCEHGFFFASELTALTSLKKLTFEIDPSALKQYFEYNYIAAPNSIYKHFFKLEAGCYLQFNNVNREINYQKYWCINEQANNANKIANQSTYSKKLNQLEKKIKTVVKNQLAADVPVGAFLSGGIDSSLVVSMMQNISNKPISTFSIGFKNSKYDEAPYAKKVANYLKTDHHEYYVTPELALKSIKKVIESYDEPFSDSSQLPTWLVSKFARQHVTVALTGDGADELFAGYQHYQQTLSMWRKLNKIPQVIKNTLYKLLSKIPDPALDRISIILSKIIKPIPPDKIKIKIKKLIQAFNLTNIQEFYALALKNTLESHKLVLDDGSSLAKPLANNADVIGDLNRLSVFDGKYYLADDLLVKVDRAAMAHSLETRIPFLDQDIIKQAFLFTEKEKITNKTAKQPLREILYKYIPKEMVDRPKHGFGIPLSNWLRNELCSMVDELLLPSKLIEQGYLNSEFVTKIWHEHKIEQADHSALIWSIVCFQLWLEKHYKMVQDE